MARLVRLGESTYLVPGSPSTLVYVEEGTAYVVDPGRGEDRAVLLAEIVSELAEEMVILLTHAHYDHLEAVQDLAMAGAVVAAPSREAAAVEDPEIRRSLVLGDPIPPGDLPWRVGPIRVDLRVEPGSQVGPLESIPLPGHSIGQLGYATPDGVLYCADAVFGERLLASVVVPYFSNVGEGLSSMDRVEEAAREFEALVPSHGPVCRRGRALRLVEKNREVLTAVAQRVEAELARGPASPEEVAARILRASGAELTPLSVALASVTVRSVIMEMAEEGRAEPVATERGLLWRA